MPQYRLSTSDGTVVQEWSAADSRAAEDQAVGHVADHRAADPPGTAEYTLAEERSGDWTTVAHWGPLAP